MKIALVRFNRDNPEDEEFADENFPDLPRTQRLLSQFIRELPTDGELAGRWKIVDVQHPSEDEMVVLVLIYHACQTLQELRKVIQQYYDAEGMNGFFEIITVDALLNMGETPACPAIQKL